MKRTHREPKPEKKEAVVDLADRFRRAEVAIVASFSGVTVDKVTKLRADMRNSKAELKVVKNTLAKRALAGTRYEGLKGTFKGPIAVALSYTDVVSPAKLLDQFVKDNEGKGLKILGGAMGEKILSVDEVKELAGLPTLEAGRAMLLGMFMQPAAGLARLLDAYARKLGGGEGSKGEAARPAEEAPAPA